MTTDPTDTPLLDQKQAAKALRRRALSGVAWLAGGRLFGQTLQTVIRLLLARLLPPEAFGIVAMASVVTALLDLVAGAGLGAALVQADKLEETHRSTAFWAVCFQGLTLALLAFFLSPLLGSFFQSTEVVPILQVLLIGSALLSPASVFEGLFSREMNFRSVALRRVIANLVGGVLAVVLAYLAFGAWALVVQRLLSGALFFGMAVISSPWKPRFLFSWKHLKELSIVGTESSATFIAIGLSKQIPNVVIGRTLGAEALGYFTLAQQILILPVQYVSGPASRVMFSLLSRLRSLPDEFRATYQLGQSITVVLAAFLPALIAASAPVAVPSLLGDKWLPAVAMLQILAVPATSRLIVAFRHSAFRAIGKPGLLVGSVVVPILLQTGGLFVGLRWGLVWATAGWALGSFGGLIYSITLAARELQVGVKAQVRPLLNVIPPVASLVGVTYFALQLLAGLPSLLSLGIACPLGSLAYFVTLRVTAPNEWRWFESKLRSFLKKRVATSTAS